ncbi:glycoside hydrolase family 43 protein [Altererythrobacter sp. KTW20L]|uniref:glycoside hydrolase family 43 protein n=1 Tax=Altererythrobacter sp. KTW20L TaxID=2942210 RepID=UPI0020BF1565|nr:glycoside hydrolase family 43 protein [Altererythrobacter sp. KTW20L]MCL6251516.1 glycoside hydrolase family 43 protein [Altererythrobacter sp. KTW20L]
MRRLDRLAALGGLLMLGACAPQESAMPSPPTFTYEGNPLVRDRHTADPAPLVVGDTLYLYVGHDEARGEEMFNITEWLAYSTKDMVTWTDHGPIMRPTDFAWAQKDAWASQVHEKDGRFWFYTTVEHDPATSHGKAIGVAVADNPLGPFVDARGSALVRNEDTAGPHHWDDIDPTVWTEPDGTSWLFWGNAELKYARLAPDMISFSGPIERIDLPDFEEGPWVFKRGDIYYLAYASMDRAISPDERISYATASSIQGPWTWRGEITGSAAKSFTIHPGIIEFRGKWYLFYHVGTLTVGDQAGAIGRRAVAVERMQFDENGLILPVEQTTQGLLLPR